MKYKLDFKKQAREDINRHKKAGNKGLLKKLNVLLKELKIHPTKGEGNPKPLKHYPSNFWSRTIIGKHRLIYEIHDNKITIEVVQAWGHYHDK